MAWVEYQGHCWPCGDGSYYDNNQQKLIYRGYQPNGQEPCKHCGTPFVKFSLSLQRGTSICCNRLPCGRPDQRIVDGVIIVGPET